jgi:hypothetical protein
MLRRLTMGALLGGLVLFAWGFVSHMLIGWYDPHFRTFHDQEAVASTLLSNVTGGGIYFLPNLTPAQQSLTGDERAAAQAEIEERMLRGPMIFSVVRVGPGTSFTVRLGIQFVLFVLAALVATWLLMNARLEGYGARVAFVASMAVLVVLSTTVPQWSWFDYPAGFVLVESADLVIGWVLLGLVLGRIARPDGVTAPR